MGVLYCRIKSKTGKKKDKIKLALSNEGVNPYGGYSDLKEITFNPNYKLESDEIFVIKKLKENIANTEIIEIDNNYGTSYEKVAREDWNFLDFVFFIENDIYYFQKIIGKKYLTIEKKLKFFDGAPKISNEIEGINIKEFADIIYNKKKDELYFKNFTKANQIFKGIEGLYREATNTEIDAFLSHSIVKKCPKFDIETITPAKRKKINSLKNNLEQVSNEKLKEYGELYCPELFEGKKINIKDLDSLDAFINIAGEFYYTGEITGSKKVSNSSKTI